MNFDDVLIQAEDPSQKDVVGLSIYFLDRVRGVDPVTSKQVKDLISKSRAGVPSSNISTYLTRLGKTRDLTSTGNGGYRLTTSGLERYSSLADLSDYEGHVRDELFIDSVEGVNEFYDSLISDINHAYREGIDDAVLILSRKLLENLVLDLLRIRYGLEDEKKELFYDLERGRLRGFAELLENLESNFDDDFNYWSDRFSKATIAEIDELKGRGDATAHSIEVNVSEG